LGEIPTTGDRQKIENKRRLNNEGLPEKLTQLRQKLNRKAAEEPAFRFYVLYDRIYRPDVLMAAYQRVRRKRGAAGVDGITFSKIEEREGGVELFLEELHESLKQKTYRPQAVKRVYIPKPDGRQRPLGIPTIRDRVAQMATLLILEPIFEADFKECSYGFRPGRSAHEALEEIRGHIEAGYQAIYDADLKSYFDTIPHDKLMICVGQRIADRMVLQLIRKWLKSPVIEMPKEGGGQAKVSRSSKGTPQGGVISPLLANLYLHYFDKLFYSAKGAGRWAGSKLVRYADDLVVMARYQTTRLKGFIEDTLEKRLKLEINREKTKVIKLKEEGASLNFLGYTFRYDRDLKGRNKKYLNVFPSKKAVTKEREKLRQMTDKSLCFKPVPMLVADINEHLMGWKNYFTYGYPRKAFREINSYARMRLTKHLKRRSQRPFKPPKGCSYYEQLARFGLIYL
jgi:RNA-directed DNA polymerase